MNPSESWKGGNRTRVNRLGTTIALATVVAVLLFALFGIALAADPTAQASRTIDPSVVEPGDEVAITVVFQNLLNVTKSFALKENIPDGWSFTRGTDDAWLFRLPPEWVWLGVGAGATKTVTYTLTVPIDTEAGNYTVDGTVTGAEVENPVGGDTTITVRVFHNLTISSTAGGSVTSPGEGTFPYDTGTVVNLAAVADEGYRFDQWTGNVSTIVDVYEASTTIVMNGDYNITAGFITVYDLTTSSTEGGSVTEPAEGTFTYDEGTVIDLLAVADACYEFINWTGDVGTIADADAASTNITMNGDYSITANFALINCDYLDYYGGWGFYCVGDEVWKHQRFHDFSCVNGTCVEVSSDYVNDQFVQNCTALDYYTDWVYYCNGTSIWRMHDFHDYYCFDGTCQEDVIPESEWYEDWDDGNPCTIDTCENGVCVHTPVYADILEYYQGLYGNPDEVSTLELLAAADDWIADVVPPCFEEPITTPQLLQLADLWISSG
jgi:hypothetical protein